MDNVRDKLSDIKAWISAYQTSDGAAADALSFATQCLRQIVSEHGTDSYFFNYAVEQFAEMYMRRVKGALCSLVEDCVAAFESGIRKTEEETAVPFAAYYALSLIYKKDNDMDELARLVSPSYTRCFQEFPLVFEVRSRYCKRCRQYGDALKYDEIAIRLLASEEPPRENHAVNISFASTVCLWLEKGDDSSAPSAEKTDAAVGYVDGAIAFNPHYPKYRFLKGKLLYYIHRREPDYEVFKTRCEQAEAEIRAAMHGFDRKHAHYFENVDMCAELLGVIDADRTKRRLEQGEGRVFKVFDRTQRDAQKAAVLAAANARDVYPERPQLKAGQKYVFVSYSTGDFKPVFCDLVELYDRRVPFWYDHTLRSCKDWVAQIREKLMDEDCLGAVIFLSEYTVLSAAVFEEIRMINERFGGVEKACLCVNLSEETDASRIMLRAIRRHDLASLIEHRVDYDRIETYLKAFPKNMVSILRAQDPLSVSHIDTLLSELRLKFPLLFEQRLH